MARLKIGTRGSKLARSQAGWVAGRLRASGHEVEIRIIRTTGDRVGAVPLAALGQQQGIKGVFTKEIEEALLAGEIDLAVHSLKDLPTELDERLSLGCIPARADPRDALVGSRLDELRPGDRVGTGSLRRAAQLGLLRPDVAAAEIRGNVDTRLGKLRAGEFDAILLAAARSRAARPAVGGCRVPRHGSDGPGCRPGSPRHRDPEGRRPGSRAARAAA